MCPILVELTYDHNTSDAHDSEEPLPGDGPGDQTTVGS
jgi:hypothetical protein